MTVTCRPAFRILGENPYLRIFGQFPYPRNQVSLHLNAQYESKVVTNHVSGLKQQKLNVVNTKSTTFSLQVIKQIISSGKLKL